MILSRTHQTTIYSSKPADAAAAALVAAVPDDYPFQRGQSRPDWGSSDQRSSAVNITLPFDCHRSRDTTAEIPAGAADALDQRRDDHETFVL